MTTLRCRVASFIGLLLLGLLSASSVSGGTTYNFENCNLGPIGVWNNGPPPGCEGWYTPPSNLVPNSAPGTVGTYSSLQQYGIVPDPTGGNNGLALKGNGNATDGTQTYDRAQHGFDFSQSSIWSVSYDLLAMNLLPSGNSYDTDYIGGMGVFNINGTHSEFTIDNGWDSPTSSTWQSIYWAYDANGNLLNPDGALPGSAWSGLLQNNWYRESTVFDENSNRILFVSITDMTTDSTTTVAPSGWYMLGGAGGHFNANAFRFSGLGWSNAELIDNVTLDPAPEPATLFLAGMGFIALIAYRRRQAR